MFPQSHKVRSLPNLTILTIACFAIAIGLPQASHRRHDSAHCAVRHDRLNGTVLDQNGAVVLGRGHDSLKRHRTKEASDDQPRWLFCRLGAFPWSVQRDCPASRIYHA